MLKTSAQCLLILLIAGCSTANSESSHPVSTKLASIPVELTTHLGDQQTFVEGDEIQFLLSLGEDAYIYMYYIDAAGKITQLLPNPNQYSHFYNAGYFMTIPEYENLYRFTISEPFGEESIWIMASDRSFDIKPPLVSIESLRKFIKHSSKNAYGEYVLNIVTRKR